MTCFPVHILKCSVQIEGNRTPITSNDLIEKSLGKFGIICVEDLIHEVGNRLGHLDLLSDDKFWCNFCWAISRLNLFWQMMILLNICYEQLDGFEFYVRFLRSWPLAPTSSTPPTSCGPSSWTPPPVDGGRRSTTSSRVSGSNAFQCMLNDVTISDTSCLSQFMRL